MKRLFLLFISLLTVYSVFYDLKHGTLPKAGEPAAEEESGIPYVEVSVKNGDTLLSIIENLEGFPEHVEISRIVEDFMGLNGGLKPEQMKPGKTYKIPVYPGERSSFLSISENH